MAKDVIQELKAAVGDTAYGKHIIADAEAHQGETGPYAQDIVDRLHEMIGLLTAYERIHKAAGEDAKATAEADKIAIAKKALKAVE